MSIFDNESSWFFIALAVFGIVAVHSCCRIDLERENTEQVKIRAQADIEVAKLAASNRLDKAVLTGEPAAGKEVGK